MACHSIGIFHLQGVEIGVAAQLRAPLWQRAHWVGGLFEPCHIKALEGVGGKCRSVGHKSVENDFTVDGNACMGQCQSDVGETESVEILGRMDGLYGGDVAIGDEVEPLARQSPEIIVFRYHQPLSAADLFFAVEHTVAYGHVGGRGRAVGARHQQGVFNAVVAVGSGYFVD